MRSARLSPAWVPTLGDTRRQADRYERQRALRSLLRWPLLTSDGDAAEDFGLVRRHADSLREWLLNYTGWTFRLTGEVARLRKTPADLADGTFPAVEGRTGLAFSKRRYVLLCLALAVLERSDQQTTLGLLADEIMAACRAEAAFAANGVVFDLSDQDQRRDLVAVVRFIVDRQVIRRIQGDEEQYLRDAHNNVLYTVNRPVLGAMVCMQRGPSTVPATTTGDRLAAISVQAAPDAEDQAVNRRLRWQVTRRLLDQPVLYYRDLTEAERAYLDRQRAHLLRQVTEATGWIAEVRREGIALLDESGQSADVRMAEEGTDGHLTLLLAQYLAADARGAKSVLVSHAAVRARTAALIVEHHKHWRRDVTEPGKDGELMKTALHRLEALRLIVRREDGIEPLPAIARFSVGDPVMESADARLLFDA